MKGRSPAAYALALRGTGQAMKHRNTPRGGRSLEMENLQAAAEEELREEAAEALAAAQKRYGLTNAEMRGSLGTVKKEDS